MDLLTQICIYGFVVVVSLRMNIYNCINSLYKQFIYIHVYTHTYINMFLQVCPVLIHTSSVLVGYHCGTLLRETAWYIPRLRMHHLVHL